MINPVQLTMRVGPKQNHVRDEDHSPLPWSCPGPFTFSNVDAAVEPIEGQLPNLVT